MVSEEKKFIFVHIPKTGGNSITTVLGKYSEDRITPSRYDGKKYNSFTVNNKKYEITKHDMLKKYEKYGYNLTDYFIFSVVRNPWDRISSYLHYHINKGSGLNTMDKLLHWMGELKNERTGLYSQLSYFKNLKGEIAVNHIIMFNDLQRGFDVVCDEIGIERIELPMVNRSKNTDINYRSVFNNYQKELIEEVYKEDIEYFGFKF